MDSLSNSGLAHPPRSNPRLRSSSCSPPLPCITPSTETCVVVVSFMSSPCGLGAPSRAAAHPCHEHLRPDPTPPSGLLLIARDTRWAQVDSSSLTWKYG